MSAEPIDPAIARLLACNVAVHGSAELLAGIFGRHEVANELIVSAFQLAGLATDDADARKRMLRVWRVLLDDVTADIAEANVGKPDNVRRAFADLQKLAPFKPVVVGGTQAPANGDTVLPS